MLLSKYVRTINYKEDVLLYHTKDHSILQLPQELLVEKNLSNQIDDESIISLRKMGFLQNTDEEISRDIEKNIINKDKLFISLELNLSCNLRCPYCYQSGKHNGKYIDDKDLDSLILYINKVYENEPFKELYIKILGGEPTLVWEKFMYIYTAAREFCRKNAISYHVLIDTNGTLIDKLVLLNGYDSLLFTIPLTYKECHDNVRFDAYGNGTYELILNNVNKLHSKLPNSKIVLRYNVDGENIQFFKKFLFDVKEKLDFVPLISVNYTAELNGSDEFGNSITYQDFVDWSSSNAIDDLIEAQLPITISPIISIEECQYRSKYSLKLFSDGTVGSCAMSFFCGDREKIGTLVEKFEGENVFFKDKQRQTLLIDKECMICDSIFLCGGTNKLPCIRALDPNLCQKKQFGISLDKFLLRYMKYQEKGYGKLFVVFEDGESYR